MTHVIKIMMGKDEGGGCMFDLPMNFRRGDVTFFCI